MNIQKKYAFVIIGLLLVLGAGMFVYAYTAGLGVVPNPGHLLSEMQGYFQNDSNLQQSLGKFCQSDGTNCVATSSGGSVEIGYSNLSNVLAVDLRNEGLFGSSQYPRKYVLPYNSTKVSKVILTVTTSSNWFANGENNMAVGTKYVFDGGSGSGSECLTSSSICTSNHLPFNQPVKLFDKTTSQNNNYVYFNVSVKNSPSPFVSPVSIDAWGDHGAPGFGGFTFNVSYERYCLMSNGFCYD